ncbi:MAG: tRNA (adenosine(37)-N6)-threonylcarbamoyltransferase complex ATPase subunit type 1 TsaE [Methylovulum sp.]|nr:tRNA (adenosine(37)-N6)-threonylcarbamoyltransferase complex ATPase subunit type 1 TsaE [Methylovulum sp.]
MKTYLHNTAETEQFGAALWRLLPATGLIFLHGDLGAGKTTLVRAYLRAGGFTGTVKSPTYTLVEEYTLDGRKICHFDLYRLTDPEELEWIGIRDYFTEGCVCFIEWPERGLGFLPESDVSISLAVEGAGRSLTISGLDDEKK